MAESMKTESQIPPQRVEVRRGSRFNPIRGLTPAVLSQQLDDFASGFLSAASYTWQKIEERDDIIKATAPKRRKAVSRHGFEIVVKEESDRAQKHKDVLEHFYGNLTCENAADRNFQGGFPYLVRTMMDAVGKMYAVHEIVYQPNSNGLTALFRFVPLWFFENTTGRLRFLEADGQQHGIELIEGEWVITAADGLMIACSIAYIYKSLSLKDWVAYNERHGMPGVIGKTDAKSGSDQWNNMVAATEQFAVEFAAVMNNSESIEAVNIESVGGIPFPEMVERMDRGISTLWRGADLSTMSAGGSGAVGASVQDDEADILESDDAQMIAETLNAQVTPHVIRLALGDDNPLAEIVIKTSPHEDVELDLKVDGFFQEAGLPQAQTDVYRRYSRSPADADEPSTASTRGDSGTLSSDPPAPLVANEKQLAADIKVRAEVVQEALLLASASEFLGARAVDLQPLAERVETILKIEDTTIRDIALRRMQSELPGLLREMNVDPRTADVLARAMNAGMLNGAAEGALTRTDSEGAGS